MLADRRIWLGIAASALFIALLLWRADLSAMGEALASANYLTLAPAVTVYFVSLLFRSLRWKVLLAPFAPTRVRRLYPVVLVGYAANNLLPLRLGELVRSYYLSTREPVRGSTALATILVERVLDGLLLLALLAGALLALPASGLGGRMAETAGLPGWAVGALLTAPFAAVLGAMLAAAGWPEAFIRITRRLTHLLPGRLGARVDGLAERFLAGFAGLHRPGRLAALAALSLPIWVMEGVMYFIVALGFGLQEPLGGLGGLLGATVVVVALSNLATALPSSQGSVGPFELFAALGLSALGVAAGPAAAYAVVLHAALLAPVIVGGLVALAVAHVRLGELVRTGTRGGE